MHRFFGAVLTLLLIGALPARAAEDPPSATVFAEPAERVALSDGRRMNVVCLGSGSPTVLFDAGTSDWSAKWILVQPAIAPSHRSCSFDRFGMGFSDPANDDPASANVLADELHALVKAAKIDTPLILVGHSLGGALSLLYAEKFPRDVAGLVLVDPYSGIFANRANDATGGIFTARRLANLAPYRACVAAAATEKLVPGSPLFTGCTDPERTEMGSLLIGSRHRVEATLAYQQTQLRDLEALNTAYPVEFNAATMNLGRLPLVVLTTGRTFAGDGPGGAPIGRLWRASHLSIAAQSKRGSVRVFMNEPHNIQLTRPAAVIDAINDVIAMVRP